MFQKQAKQAITIYIDMHGTDVLDERLVQPRNFTHTFVSTVGKLGCLSVFKNENTEKYCEQIDNYKGIFQGKTICESNKMLEELDVYNDFENVEKMSTV